MKANKKSLYQEGGSVAKDSINPVVSELSDVIKNNIESGGSPEEILKTFLLQGIPVDQLTLAFESAGLDPSLFGELLQNVEIMMAQEEQAQQQPQQAAPVKPSMMQPQNEEQPPMQYGGNVSSGYLSPTTQDERPIYMPPVPAKGNVLGAAFLLDDATSRLFSGKDENNDGIADGTFRDWKAKNARYKQKQLRNRSYDIDFGGNDPSNYMLNINDLAEGTVRTKDQYKENILNNSLVTGFDPEAQKFSGYIGSRAEDINMLGKKQREELGLLGEKREGVAGFFGLRKDPIINPDNKLSSFLSRVEGLDPIQLEMMAEQLKGRDKETKGTGLNMNYQQYADKDYTPEELKEMRNQYANVMMGTPMSSVTDMMSSVFPSASNENFAEPKQRSIVELPKEEVRPPMAADSFKDWAKKNQVKLQMKGLTTEAQQQAAYEAASEFKYGGGLPKAQYGIPGSGMGSMFLDQQSLEKELGDLNQIDETADSLSEDTLPGPTVKRKRSVGNALDQAETFIKENPAMRAFGDVSDFAVKGANLANEIFQQKEFNDYKNKLRNSTAADNIYLATENPVNKRGTFDANLGLAEPDNLVDYYAQAMYGKELYKKGGEFEPHMMYDPVSGKGYKANVEADHNRFVKLGFLHQDEMQDGGSVTPEMKKYLDALEFNKVARQAIGTNDKESLRQLSLDKPYNSNDLARDFSELQKLRQAAGLGLGEEASIIFPHVGQQIRGSINSLLGTNFEQGGELEVDNDTLAALIAAGADIEIL